MEERKVKKSTKRKNEMMLRIISVVLAVIIWIILSITLFPTINTTVYDVPVKLDISGTFAEENGLSVVNFNQDTTVDVKISGMRYEIGSYDADDLIATVDVSEVYKPGTYNLDITVRSANGDNCSMVKVSPSTVKVKFDYNKSLEFPLEVEYTGISADEGYTLKAPVVSPETVTVTGSESEIAKINKAVIRVNDQKLKLTETYSTENTELVFYSNTGAELDSSNLTLSQESFKVTFPVYMSKTVPLTLDIKQTGSYFSTDTLNYTIYPETITIQSTKDISGIESINVGSLNLNEIDLDREYEFEITLESDLQNANGVEKAVVKFDGTGITSKTFTLESENIKILNAPSGKKVTVKTANLTDVVIMGPQADIEKLTADDIVVEYDMQSSEFENGNVEVTAIIYSPKFSRVWYSGDERNIILTVSNKTTLGG